MPVIYLIAVYATGRRVAVSKCVGSAYSFLKSYCAHEEATGLVVTRVYRLPIRRQPNALDRLYIKTQADRRSTCVDTNGFVVLYGS